MENALRKIRAVSLVTIVGGLVVVGGSPEPVQASGMVCQFCVQSCPTDVEEFCEDEGCAHFGAACQYVGGTPGSCYPFTIYQINCNLI